MEQNNKFYCEKILFDEEFAQYEVGKALIDGDDAVNQLHSRIMNGLLSVLEERLAPIYAFHIAWDIIVSILAPDEQQPRNPDQLKRDDSSLWNCIYKGFYETNKPKNEKAFKEWFVLTLSMAMAKKINVKWMFHEELNDYDLDEEFDECMDDIDM